MRALAALVFIAAAFVGCTRGADVPRRTLTIALQEEPDSLNPALATQYVSNDPIALMFDGLVKVDAHGRIVPDLALAVPSRSNGGISGDGRILTYHLRHNVRWHDGAPFTSADVRFTWKALTNPRNNVPTAFGYDRIADVRTPDGDTVEVVLREPYAPALDLFADAKQGAILPAHLLAGMPNLNRAGFNNAPVGTGPYRLVAWNRGDSLAFERNPYYWTRPEFDAVRLRLFGNESAATVALLSRGVDAILNVHPTQVPQLKRAAGVSIASRPSLHWEHLTFNLRPGSGPQADLHVRRAIAYAIDVGRLAATVFHIPLQDAPLDQSPLSWARDPTVRYYPYDVARARRELRASGSRHVALTIVSSSDSAARGEFEVQLQQMLADIGIPLTIKNVSASLLLAPAASGGILFGGRFQIALFSFATPIPDPDDARYVASSAIPPNGFNLGAYNNPAVNRLVTTAAITYDRAERTLLYAQVQRHLIADLPFYTLAWSPETVAYASDLRGVEPAPVGSDLWNVATWHRQR